MIILADIQVIGSKMDEFLANIHPPPPTKDVVTDISDDFNVGGLIIDGPYPHYND